MAQANGSNVGFRCRAALLLTVEQSAQRYANQTGTEVNIFGVQGGYEARSTERGSPAGSHRLLKTLTKQTATAPAKTEPAKTMGKPAPRARVAAAKPAAAEPVQGESQPGLPGAEAEPPAAGSEAGEGGIPGDGAEKAVV